jgi:hypothetical protein
LLQQSPERRFNTRPEFLLVGVELEAGMQGSDAGVCQGGPVFG